MTLADPASVIDYLLKLFPFLTFRLLALVIFIPMTFASIILFRQVILLEVFLGTEDGKSIRTLALIFVLFSLAVTIAAYFYFR